LGDSSRASSNVFLTSRQNFLVRSSFIDSLMMLSVCPHAAHCGYSLSGATFLAALLPGFGDSNPLRGLPL
jgi:hypothetical protein